MFRSAINRLKFDFTCSSESVAQELQREIFYYGMPEIQEIIAQVFARDTEKRIREIDTIEIDLGDITAKGLSDNRVLGQFKTALENALRKGQLHQLDSINPELKEWIILQTFLLHGDVPWWVDKANYFNLDHLILKLLEKQSQGFWSFLESNSRNSKVQERIRSQFPLKIRRLLQINPVVLPRKEATSCFLSKSAIISILKVEDRPDTISALKSLMIHSVLSILDIASMSIIQLPGVLLKQDLSLIYQFVKRNKANAERTIKVLDKLSLMQLEFLLYTISLKNKKSTVITDQNRVKQKSYVGSHPRIKSICKMLKSMEPGLLKELAQYNEHDLLVLEKSLMQIKQHNTVKTKLILMLLNQPLFLHYGMLFLPAELSANLDKDEQLRFKVQLASHRTNLSVAIGKLMEKDVLILNNIIHKGKYETAAEQVVLVKLMHELPEEYLKILANIAVIDKAEFEFLSGNDRTTAIDVLFEPTRSEQELNKIVVENAGLVLMAAYLPALFNYLGYMEGGRFKDIITRSRALYLLQYIATGQQYSPEYVLQLNKLLCGFALDEAIIGYKKRLTKKEKEEASSLLISAIGHWKALKGTSVNGFRSAFTERKGLMVQDEDCWILQVEKKSYDVLLDSIPWSFSVIKLPWMKKRIEVEW
jgi:hypothetical protein